MKEESTFTLKIYRGNPGKQYWETFVLKRRASCTVIAALMEIQRNPINSKGEKVTPVVWESGCLEEVCGSCSILVNGTPCQACTALIEPIIKKSGNSTVTIAPLSKFPLVRDLIVDRGQMFENLKKITGWIEEESLQESGPGPKISQQKQEILYILSTCMTCGCCSEACPQINEKSQFLGPAAVAQVRLFNTQPKGKNQKADRLHAMMEKDGISACGNAQNCVRVCPKNIPLTDAIAAISRDTTKQALLDLFSLPERD